MKTKISVRRFARRLCLRLAAGVALTAVTPAGHSAEAAPPARRPLVQLALLLDTSNSMDGLLTQAKGQLWKVVNEFSRARQDGAAPEVQVALFEYGKNSLPAAEGYLRQIVPLTTDLDKISEELFALRTNGGEEYCGWVIKEAVERLAWSAARDVYKAIFIAGNEPFTQGPVAHADACRNAIARGIIVNTIHCGSERTGIETKWQDGALLADGRYLVIDQNNVVAHVPAPQDAEIARLGEALNRTYLAYGAAGAPSAARQAAQDANAAALAPQGARFQRAVAKASPAYRNESWDLVDAMKTQPNRLAELQEAELPAEMRTMNATERKAHVEARSRERAELQAKINQLNAERAKHVAGQQKQEAAAGPGTLDAALITAIREQATQRNFRFE